MQRADVARLTAIPGIGKKTAERIVLELRDRLSQLAPPPVAGLPATPAGHERLRADLVSALLNLGYHRPQAEKAADTAVSHDPDVTFEQALKQALRELVR